MLIGRDKEQEILQQALKEEYSQFIAVYGRRRVGKTFLIRESYNYEFAFQYTGAAKLTARQQLVRFRNALKQHGLKDVPVLTNWMDAFYELERYLKSLPEGKKVVFLDELSWMDAPRSNFLSMLESFWNGWATMRKDIVLVVCGSSTSWMVKKILRNRGGLHNRLNHRIVLRPFPLKQCEQLAKHIGLHYTRQQILDAYMVFGGVPYYWTLLQKGASLNMDIDRLIFANDGDLHDEYQELYYSLFKQPELYISTIEALAQSKAGLTREQLIAAWGTKAEKVSGTTTAKILDDLEWCGFIRKYHMIGNKKKGAIYQLIDHFTIFYLDFMTKNVSADFWQKQMGSPRYNTWCGYAFERVCLWHVDQIKKALGISGIYTEQYAWRQLANAKENIKGTQVDLLIDRRDGIIDLCEIKHYKTAFAISSAYANELQERETLFREATHTKKAVHTIMITTNGLVHNENAANILGEVTLDNLFEE